MQTTLPLSGGESPTGDVATGDTVNRFGHLPSLVDNANTQRGARLAEQGKHANVMM